MSRRDPLGIGYDPDILRSLLDAYERILVAAEKLRAEYNALPDLLALATIVDEIEGKRDGCIRRLDRIESKRHTQARRAAPYDSVPPLKCSTGCAADTPARGADVEPFAERAASMGHGCPALDLAVGPAPRHVDSGLHNPSDNALFCAQSMKELQSSENQANNRPESVGENV